MWSNPHETADLVTFTKETLNGKLHFLCSGTCFVLSSFYLAIPKCPTSMYFNLGLIFTNFIILLKIEFVNKKEKCLDLHLRLNYIV